jgi:shikimate dehydrogenase
MRMNERQTYSAGLIGAGIGGSLSPGLHEREAWRLGLESSYRLFDLDVLGRPPDEVGALVREARELGLSGVNVTHPCKQLVVPELDELSDEAAALHAVNAVVFDGDRLVGHNTDTTGFQEAFVRGLPGAELERVVLLGAGGAGAAVAHALLGVGVQELAVVDVDASRALELVGSLAARFGDGCARGAGPEELGRLLAAADGLAHATPTGMTGHAGTAVPADLLRPALWVADIVYVPVDTRLLLDARARGCRTLPGTAMVALQAAGSMELFAGLKPDRERMLAHAEQLTADARQAA